MRKKIFFVGLVVMLHGCLIELLRSDDSEWLGRGYRFGFFLDDFFFDGETWLGRYNHLDTFGVFNAWLNLLRKFSLFQDRFVVNDWLKLEFFGSRFWRI